MSPKKIMLPKEEKTSLSLDEPSLQDVLDGKYNVFELSEEWYENTSRKAKKDWEKEALENLRVTTEEKEIYTTISRIAKKDTKIISQQDLEILRDLKDFFTVEVNIEVAKIGIKSSFLITLLAVCFTVVFSVFFSQAFKNVHLPSDFLTLPPAESIINILLFIFGIAAIIGFFFFFAFYKFRELHLPTRKSIEALLCKRNSYQSIWWRAYKNIQKLSNFETDKETD